MGSNIQHAPAARQGAPALTREERIFTMVGVLLALLLAALDQTIVSTAGPAIQHDLRMPPSLYPWITTAYLVAATVMVPIYGKLSDSFGRKPVLLAGVGLFLIGSFLCGIAPSTGALIAFRAVQGLGAASLFTTAFAVIADLFPPVDRGKYMGLIGGVMGVASVIGPLVGGFITDVFGWHWVFYINLPVGAVALWFIITRMPRLGAPAAGTRPRVDLPGAIWLITAVVPLLVAFSLGRTSGASGGGGFAWGSWQILGMLGVTVVGVAGFLVAERRAADPILDLRIFRNRTIGLGSAAMFVLGASFLFAVVFLPLFLVNVVGISATRAGLTMMPLTLGVVAGSVASGQLVARIGRTRELMLGSLVLLVVGFAVMAFTLSTDSTQGEVTLKMILVGLGIGPSFPLYTLVVQNAAEPKEVGVVTAASTFARSLGQVMGVAVLGSVFAASLAASLGERLGEITAGLSPGAAALVASVAPSVAGSGEETAIAFDTTAVKARIRRSVALATGVVAAGTGSPVVVPGGRAPIGPGPAPAAPRISRADELAALAAVDAISLAFRESLTIATSLLYRLGIGVVLVAVALTLFIPDQRLQQAPAPAVEGAHPPPLEI